MPTTYRITLDDVVYLLEREGAGFIVRLIDATRVASLFPSFAHADNGDRKLAQRLFDLARSHHLL